MDASESVGLQALADAVSEARAAALGAAPERLDCRKLVQIARQCGADDPEVLVADVLCKLLERPPDGGPLAPFLTLRVRSRARNAARLRRREERTARKSTVDDAAGHSTTIEQTVAADQRALQEARVRAVRTVASIGLAERYIAACGKKYRVDPEVVAQLRDYELAQLTGAAAPTGLKRQTREKIERSVKKTLQLYVDVLVATLVVLVWRVRSAGAAILGRSVVALAGALACLVVFVLLIRRSACSTIPPNRGEFVAPLLHAASSGSDLRQTTPMPAVPSAMQRDHLGPPANSGFGGGIPRLAEAPSRHSRLSEWFKWKDYQFNAFLGGPMDFGFHGLDAVEAHDDGTLIIGYSGVMVGEEARKNQWFCDGVAETAIVLIECHDRTTNLVFLGWREMVDETPRVSGNLWSVQAGILSARRAWALYEPPYSRGRPNSSGADLTAVPVWYFYDDGSASIDYDRVCERRPDSEYCRGVGVWAFPDRATDNPSFPVERRSKRRRWRIWE